MTDKERIAELEDALEDLFLAICCERSGLTVAIHKTMRVLNKLNIEEKAKCQ